VRVAGYPVVVRYLGGAERKLEDVLRAPLTGPGAKGLVKVRDVATVRRAAGPVEVERVDARLIFEVLIHVEGRDVAAVAAEVEKVVGKVKVPEGVVLEALRPGAAGGRD
jgi:Cu/Ag efflux pump CusA